MCSFLRGLYAANGSVVGAGAPRVTLKAASLQVILDVQEMLSSVGIASYYTTNKPKDVTFANGSYTSKQSYDLNITVDAERFQELIGFVHPHKEEKLVKGMRERRPSALPNPIKSRVYQGMLEVFDITVDAPEHTYWTGGLLVSNCGEASVNLNFCNLTTFNMGAVESQNDLNEFAKAAAFLGTLQAGYTDFHYLRGIWKEKTEKEALLGVSMTGVARKDLTTFDLRKAVEIVAQENIDTGSKIGVNPAYRLTVNKPEGTSSVVLGTSSGVHAWHSQWGVRRTQYLVDDPLVVYLRSLCPELFETHAVDPNRVVLTTPVRAPVEAITGGNETSMELLERIKYLSENWIKPGHRKGDNGHSVSATVNFTENEWDDILEWMWKNRDSYNGLTLYPIQDNTHEHQPFEETTEAEYKELLKKVPKKWDLKKVNENYDNTDLQGELACAADGCEIS